MCSFVCVLTSGLGMNMEKKLTVSAAQQKPLLFPFNKFPFLLLLYSPLVQEALPASAVASRWA